MGSVVFWSWVLLIVFVVMMMFFGVMGMKRPHNNDDFATARSSYGSITIALVIAAGISSGSSFMGLPGLAIDLGALSLWYPLLYSVATGCGMLFFAKVIKDECARLGIRFI